MNYNYTLEGKYTKIARTLNTYSSTSTLSLVRKFSDLYSFSLMKLEEHYSNSNLNVLALNFTEGRDFYTGSKIVDEENILIPEITIHRDHLIPASKGGLYAYGNVVITTSEANLDKSDKDPIEYYQSRFDRGLPTLYATMEEATAALTFLNDLYKNKYPNAYEAIIKYELMEDPIDLLTFNNWCTYFISDNKDIKLSIKGVRRERKMFSDNLKDIEFWNKLNDVNSIIYKKYSPLTIKDITGARLVNISKLFDDEKLSVLDTKPSKIKEMIHEFIKDKSKSEKNKYRCILKSILLYRKSCNDYNKKKKEKIMEN